MKTKQKRVNDIAIRKSALRTSLLALGFFGAMLFALCAPTEAQQATKVPRVGYLTAVSLSANAARIEAFRQGLRELGYVEGKNIIIEWRGADGKPDRLPVLAAELV